MCPTRYRLFFKNATANIAAMVDIGKQFGAKGWNIDFEPQVCARYLDPTTSIPPSLLIGRVPREYPGGRHVVRILSPGGR